MAWGCSVPIVLIGISLRATSSPTKQARSGRSNIGCDRRHDHRSANNGCGRIVSDRGGRLANDIRSGKTWCRRCGCVIRHRWRIRHDGFRRSVVSYGRCRNRSWRRRVIGDRRGNGFWQRLVISDGLCVGETRRNQQQAAGLNQGSKHRGLPSL